MLTKKPEIGSIVQDNTGRQYKVMGLGSKMAVLETVPSSSFPFVERLCMGYRDFFPVVEEAKNSDEFAMNEFKKELELYS